jgi:hypothetical protein
MIRITITTESTLMKPSVYRILGTIRGPNRLSNQCAAKSKMISSNKEIF